jgi:lysophospholipase L1-like esterase
MKHKKIFFSTKIFLVFILVFSGINTFAQIKVACIGNSITKGAGLKKTEAYPAQLQLVLGDQYEVKNFGLSGFTLLKNGDLPYMKTKMYRDALAWQPDVVIIKLGTNDSKPQNWKYKEEYLPNYLEMVTAFKALPSSPKVYVCYPLPAFLPMSGINDSIIRNDIIPMVKMVGKKTKSKVINLYRPFKKRANLTSDGIHPTSEGAIYLAKLIGKAIQ